MKPPKIPSFMKQYLAKQALAAGPLDKKIYKDMWSDMFILEHKLNKITAPTLIVWGDSDKLVHISSVPIFEKNIKNSKSVIIKECGHAPHDGKTCRNSCSISGFFKGAKLMDNKKKGN